MKLTNILALKAQSEWEKAVNQNFVNEMALGTLSPERFSNYMMQDYLYLLDYIDILNLTRDLAASEEENFPDKAGSAPADPANLCTFLDKIIEDTQNETYRVHIPNMKKIGISDAEMASCKKADIIVDYVAYMKKCLTENGLLAGLTALLQCSWVYAYIGEKMLETHSADIAASPYKCWFGAYACKEYVDSNNMWIDFLDKKTTHISEEETGKLCEIFETCAKFENKFWEVL